MRMNHITQAFTKFKFERLKRKLTGNVRKVIRRKRREETAIAISKERKERREQYKSQMEAARAKQVADGKRSFHLSWEQEKQFMDAFKEKARQGNIATAFEIKDAYEELCGGYVGKTIIFLLLKEHQWFEVAPLRSHTKKAHMRSQESK